MANLKSRGKHADVYELTIFLQEEIPAKIAIALFDGWREVLIVLTIIYCLLL